MEINRHILPWRHTHSLNITSINTGIRYKTVGMLACEMPGRKTLIANAAASVVKWDTRIQSLCVLKRKFVDPLSNFRPSPQYIYIYRGIRINLFSRPMEQRSVRTNTIHNISEVSHCWHCQGYDRKSNRNKISFRERIQRCEEIEAACRKRRS